MHLHASLASATSGSLDTHVEIGFEFATFGDTTIFEIMIMLVLMLAP